MLTLTVTLGTVTRTFPVSHTLPANEVGTAVHLVFAEAQRRAEGTTITLTVSGPDRPGAIVAGRG